MQKTKKKRYKCEKNTKFSKMQKIKGFGAYSKMSLTIMTNCLSIQLNMSEVVFVHLLTSGKDNLMTFIQISGIGLQI